MRTRQETLWLMSHALGLSTASILARRTFTTEELAKVEALTSRRDNGEPLQYIMEAATFWGRDFTVGPGVLIPRQDTETLVQAAIRHIPNDEAFTFIDWGTGSGCIAITLMLEYPLASALMLENSPEASRYAALNLERYALTRRGRIISSVGDVEASSCRLIVSNPPYIPSSEIDGLAIDVRDFEPRSALDGGADGLDCYREILLLARNAGCEYLILEVGSIEQVQALKAMCDNFRCIDELQDGGGFTRCLVFKQEAVQETQCKRQ